MIVKDLIEVKKLIDDLYWDYDRLSSDGKDTLNNISNLLGISTEETELNQGKKWLRDGVYGEDDENE
jgi:hypothetical protein